MTSRMELACSRTVMHRALKYALVVGAILIAINHGDALVHSEITAARLARMILTMFVPYAVSTASSVSAVREAQAHRGAGRDRMISELSRGGSSPREE